MNARGVVMEAHVPYVRHDLVAATAMLVDLHALFPFNTMPPRTIATRVSSDDMVPLALSVQRMLFATMVKEQANTESSLSVILPMYPTPQDSRAMHVHQGRIPPHASHVRSIYNHVEATQPTHLHAPLRLHIMPPQTTVVLAVPATLDTNNVVCVLCTRLNAILPGLHAHPSIVSTRLN